jgi:hypothetical protein
MNCLLLFNILDKIKSGNNDQNKLSIQPFLVFFYLKYKLSNDVGSATFIISSPLIISYWKLYTSFSIRKLYKITIQSAMFHYF